MMMLLRALILIILVLFIKGTHCLDKIRINEKWFTDESGRTVLFRGINAVRKSHPWIPNEKYINMTNKTQLHYLSREWGFNVVRLGVMWTGLIPVKNEVNQTYLNQILEIIDTLALFKIYVIIDLHQDMMSSQFNSYDGVPLWVMKELPLSKFPFPWPFKDGSKLVFEAYVTEACGFAFQCLYKNNSNFQNYFLQYWSIVAKNLANRTSVLAYELINEPWAGDIFANPLTFLPGIAGKHNLMPIYDKTYDKIREYDSKTLIFYEPVTWSVMSSEKFLGIGFDRPPKNDIKSTVLAWHYYCWLLQTNSHPLTNNTLPIFEKVFCDGWQATASFKTVDKDMINLGGGANFLTEFGVCSFNAENTSNPKFLNTDECELILDNCDRYFTSWSYWDSNFYFDNFEISYQLVNVFSRVYPRYTNGIPLSLKFNLSTGHFIYSFKMNLNASDLFTEIFIPDHVYPKGFEVVTQPELAWYFNSNDKTLYVNLKSDVTNNTINYFFVMIFKN